MGLGGFELLKISSTSQEGIFKKKYNSIKEVLFENMFYEKGPNIYIIHLLTLLIWESIFGDADTAKKQIQTSKIRAKTTK